MGIEETRTAITTEAFALAKRFGLPGEAGAIIATRMIAAAERGRRTQPHPCQRCGSEEWTWCDYRGCSDCFEPEPENLTPIPGRPGWATDANGAEWYSEAWLDGKQPMFATAPVAVKGRK